MAIETLLNRQINIADFHPLEEKPKGKFERMYEELKNSPFYDKERGLWRYDVGYSFHTSDQLLGVLVEAFFDKKGAKNQYEKLKQSRFYNTTEDRWNPSEESNEYNSTCELRGVMIECIFDKERAKKQFEHLKWIERWKGMKWDNQPIYNKLTSVLVEEMFDPEKAQELFEKLKKTPYYDQEQWRDGRYENSYLKLMGILTEGTFDKKKAKKKYRELKKTELYTEGLWNGFLSEGESLGKPTGTDQLLGLLVETSLEENELIFIPEKQISVPEVRKF
jgi:hypothetical protein